MMTWTEVIEELAARVTEEIETDEFPEITETLVEIRSWLLEQEEPLVRAAREDSERVPAGIRAR